MIITDKEQELILNWVENYDQPNISITNPHVKEVNDSIDGYSVLYDITKTDISKYISKFQGNSTLIDAINPLFTDIGSKVAKKLKLCENHVFFQLICIGSEGYVKPHYDAGIPGYITYKANIPIIGPDPDKFYYGKNIINTKNKEIYCFEANLFKHWMNKCGINRILLSYGFILPYADLGWDEDSPRVRLSNKIWKHYINEFK